MEGSIIVSIISIGGRRNKFTVICYSFCSVVDTFRRPSLSSLVWAWIHRQCCFVGAPPRHLMAGVLVCLRIFLSATVLVAMLFVAACGAGVPALNIESTGEAHIPVVVVFNWIGRCAGRLKGRRRDVEC